MTTNSSSTGTNNAVRIVLWVLLVLFGAANIVASTSDLNIFFGIGFGVLTGACAVALAVQHYKQRIRND